MKILKSIKTYSLQQCAIMLLVGLVVLFSVIVNVSAQQSDSQTADDVGSETVEPIDNQTPGDECLKCHQNTWDSAISKSYIHTPFLEKKCILCHIHDDELIENSREFMQDRNVDWLASRRVTTTTHWFTVPLSKINDLVLVDFQVPGKGTVRDEIVIPLLDEITELVDDEEPPQIDEIRVKDLNRGLFLTATIAWRTDELATSQLYYGLKKINKESEHSYNFTKNHSVQLSGLKFKKKYKFKIVSEDIFGNRSESKELVFSTSKAKRKSSLGKNCDIKYPDLKTKFKLYRIEDNCIIRIGANRPVIMALGTPKLIEETEEDLKADGLIPENHNLKDALMTNSTVCEPCHGKYVKDRNHPINVSAKPGMKIPEEYFVLSNGNITCMTCHSAHSSNIEYRMVRTSKRDLCIGCHLKKI